MFFCIVRRLIFSFLTNKKLKTIIFIKILIILSFFKLKLRFFVSLVD